MAFAGTVTLSKATFISVVKDVAASLARHGFTNIVFIPSHGGNFGPLSEAMAQLEGQLPGARAVAYTDLLGFVKKSNETAARFGVTPEQSGAHAGETETSVHLHLRPDLVLMDRAVAGYVGPFGPDQAATIFSKGMPALTPNGVLGDARLASAEHGRVYLETKAEFLAAWIRDQVQAQTEPMLA